MSECKVNTALEALVGKWKHKLLFPLLTNETMRFNELKRAIPGITQKMLTSQLLLKSNTLFQNMGKV